jgi:DNA-binding NtrC family response regulator
LNVVHIRVPALRERPEDLPELAASFVKTYAAKHGREVQQLAPEAMSLLKEYEFPGNVRELANVIERATIMSEGKRIEVGQLPDSIAAAVASKERRTKPPPLAQIEADYVDEILTFAGGNKTEAARILGISRKNLYEKLARRQAKDDG